MQPYLKTGEDEQAFCGSPVPRQGEKAQKWRSAVDAFEHLRREAVLPNAIVQLVLFRGFRAYFLVVDVGRSAKISFLVVQVSRFGFRA